MPIITLPNGDQKQFDHPISVMDLLKALVQVLQKIQLQVVSMIV
jgi:threonyl-tRNA synthetase